MHALTADGSLVYPAARLVVVCVPSGHAAYILTGEGIVVAPHQAAAYVVDHARDEEFVQMIRLSKRVSSCEAQVQHKASKEVFKYSIVNLQPGEYIVLQVTHPLA